MSYTNKMCNQNKKRIVIASIIVITGAFKLPIEQFNTVYT